jgi:ATP-dependent exoDNAse (exonuclease V) beta subunit
MTDNFIPIDQAERERIETSLKETLFVEAGAGTGKTTALVSRIISLVKAGNEISHIAAITFTEAAAAELRDRVRRELEKAAVQEGNDFCLKAAANLDSASIQTLHGFAGAILREQPLEAGLPPGFEVIEQIEAGIDFEERWQQWLDEAMDSEITGSALIRAMRLGLSLDKLKDAALKFHENYDILPDSFPAESKPGREFASNFVNTVSGLENLLCYARNGEEDQQVKHCRRLLRIARRMETAHPESDAGLVILSRAGRIFYNSGRKADWNNDPQTGENACIVIKEELKALQIEVLSGLELICRAAIIPLLESLRQFVLNYAAKRRREGKAQFHDLLIWTRDLLENNQAARRYYQEKFSHILIDEFQDTDPIQAKIAFFLAENADPTGQFEKDWLKISAVPGKLFVVGDTKQSIYRFRRADIVTVTEVKEMLTGADADKNVVPLIQNFRSQSPVIAWVNAVFSECMIDDGTRNQACYLPLEARWEPQPSNPPAGVHCLGGAVEGRANDIRRKESDDIARTILTLKSRPWHVRDEKSTGLRAVKYQDICLLMPTRTGLSTLERTLDEWNIPYRIESQSMLLETQDVKEILACMRAIDAPADKIALTAALRSSAFSISDTELLQYIEDGGNLDYTQPGGADGPVREALDILADYHNRHIWQTPAEVIEDFIRQRGMEEVSFCRPRPRERLHRLQFVVEKARSFSEVRESSLRGFLDWIERLADEEARMTDVPVPETDEDAVRIMTIHAAKGREFPVVILTGLSSEPGNKSQPVLFDRRKNTVEVSLGVSTGQKFTTAGYEDACSIEKAAEEAERIRLMYVAATRAKDHLVISLYRKSKKTDSSFAKKLENICNKTAELWQDVEFQQSTADSMARGEKDTDGVISTEADRARWIEARRLLLKKASKPVTISATTIARINKESVEDEFPYRTGRGGTKLGRAVHSVLQTINLGTGEGLDKTAAAQAANEGIPERTQEVIELVQNALSSAAIKRATASNRFYREVFVSAPLNKCSVNGFIDLLFEEDGGFVIVDYKTDDIDEIPSRTKYAQYSIQAGIYALATSRVLGKPIKEVILLFLKGQKEISFKDLDHQMALAEKAVDKTASSYN